MNNVFSCAPTWSNKPMLFGLGVGTGTALTMLVILCLTHQEDPCSQESTQGDVKREYVFTTLNGKAVTLSEQDVFKIVQMNASGVLPSVIAMEFGLSISTVSMIIISITNHKK